MTTNLNVKESANTNYGFETWLLIEYDYTWKDYSRMSNYDKASLRQEYNALHNTDK